jgi:hypothetical protein
LLGDRKLVTFSNERCSLERDLIGADELFITTEKELGILFAAQILEENTEAPDDIDNATLSIFGYLSVYLWHVSCPFVQKEKEEDDEDELGTRT